MYLLVHDKIFHLHKKKKNFISANFLNFKRESVRNYVFLQIEKIVSYGFYTLCLDKFSTRTSFSSFKRFGHKAFISVLF